MIFRRLSRLIISFMMSAMLAHPATAQVDGSSTPNTDTFADQVDLSAFGTIAVHSRGRVKSFDSFTSEMMQFVCGTRRIDGQSPSFTYLDLMLRPERYIDRDVIFIRMKMIRTQIALALRTAGAAQNIPEFEDRMERFLKSGLISESLLRRDSVQMLLNRLRADIIRTSSKVEAIESAINVKNPEFLRGSLAVVPASAGGTEDAWLTLDALSGSVSHNHDENQQDQSLEEQLVHQWLAFVSSWQQGDAPGVNAAGAQLASLLPLVNPDLYPAQSRLSWESWYFRVKNMTWVWIIYLFSIIPLLASMAYRWPAARWIGMGLFVIAFGLHTFAVMLRWYVAERWPNSNMFEAITTAAWFGGCFAVIIELLVRHTPMRSLFALGSAVASMVALMATRLWPLDLRADISNMMPVLHDLWLYIHTNVIIFSYCLIFLASVTSGLYLVRRIWFALRGQNGSSDFVSVGGAGSLIATRSDGTNYLANTKTTFGQVLDGSTMILMELSFILLWTGLVMGAIWADHSWGRPWGWDPKEVFALNTFIIFALLIHVRIKVKDKGLWTALLAIVGCGVMLFNWVIINFAISGLHSYA